MSTNLSRGLWLLLALGFLLLGVMSAKHLAAALVKPSLALSTIQLLPQPKPLPPVMLRRANGDAFAREKFQQQWNLVFFGFTSCPDFCPMELRKLGKVLRLAHAAGQPLRVVFVSVDPERDSGARLADYVAFFHPDIIGLRGDNPAIANLAQFFGASYDRSAIVNSKLLRVPAGAPMPLAVGEDYQVSHSTRVFVVDPQGQYLGSAMNIESAELLWADLQKLF